MLLNQYNYGTVSYTHLDVYKRQVLVLVVVVVVVVVVVAVAVAVVVVGCLFLIIKLKKHSISPLYVW